MERRYDVIDLRYEEALQQRVQEVLPSRAMKISRTAPSPGRTVMGETYEFTPFLSWMEIKDLTEKFVGLGVNSFSFTDLGSLSR